LSEEHQISDTAPVNEKLENCRIGRNCQARFWCGFCTKLVELKKKGLEAWTERFDHIDDHFMGRHNWPRQGIQDWIPVDSDKPKGDVPSYVPGWEVGSGDRNSPIAETHEKSRWDRSSGDAIILGADDETIKPIVLDTDGKISRDIEITVYCVRIPAA
jgi:hypothetical protein